MDAAFPEALVEDFENLVDALELPDPDDRHVLACAIQANASVIVTDNLKDFPSNRIERHDTMALGLDDCIADTLDLAGAEAIAAVKRMRERFGNPEMESEEPLRRVEKLGLAQSVVILAKYQRLL